MQLEAPAPAGVEDADLLAQPILDHVDGQHQVGVVGDYYGQLVVVLEAVQQQVGGEIDVGPFFLGIEYLHDARAGLRLPGQGPSLGLGQQVSVVDSEVGNGRQGAEVRLLALRLGGVIGPVGDQGGKVAYPADGVAGEQQPRQPPQVQPPVGRSAKGAVIEIQAVDVDVGADERGIPKKAEAAFRQPRALPPRRSGGVQVKGT